MIGQIIPWQCSYGLLCCTLIVEFLSAAQVKAAARAYRVYYTKTNDDPKDYLVDHSIIMYLLDPKGDFVTFFGKNVGEDELAAGIWDHIKKWKGPK